MKRLLGIIFVVMMVAAACAEQAPEAEESVGTAPLAAPATTEAPMDDGHEEDVHEEDALGDFDRTVDVVMTEFAFEPAAVSVTAGETVKFVVRNDGLVEHEFELTTTHDAEEHVAGGHEGHDEPGSDADGKTKVAVPPGATAELVVAFDEHSTFDLMVCLVPGHFEAGMKGAVTVAGAMAMGDAGMHDDEAAEHDDEAMHDDEAAEHDDSDGHHDAEASGEFDRTVEVVMTDFAYDPGSLSVTAGETVRFVLINEGAIEHEFRLTTAHAAEEHIASGHAGHDDEGGDGGHGHDEIVVLVQPGATETVDVTFDDHADFDQFACLIPDHYEAGMFGTFAIGA